MDAKRFQCTPSPFSLSFSLSFYSLLFSPSLVPAHLAASLSHFRTFSLIWQQSEPCRWKSFQRISRKLIYFCNKYDPLEWIHLYTSRCTKQEVVSGPRLPLLHTPRLSLPVYPTRWSHTYTHTLSSQSLLFPPHCVKKTPLLTWNNMYTRACIYNCNWCPFHLLVSP